MEFLGTNAGLCIYQHCSRNAATVNSQGRKPLVREAFRSVSPNGAAVRWPSYCRPVGAYDSRCVGTRGSRPWLLTYAPLGLHAVTYS